MQGNLIITCPKGLSDTLKAEVLGLALPVTSASPTHVSTEGDILTAMRLNLHLRTGHRVLQLLTQFSARSAADLYKAVSSLPWEEYLESEGYFTVTSTVDTASMNDTSYPRRKCKDAIVDRLRHKTGKRPESGPLRTGAVIHLLWKDRDCALYIDTSGEPLSRRGYRKLHVEAPMQETLAAALMLSTGWTGKENLLNPFCGSGTLAIEAALIALNKPPGLLRDNFGFMHLRSAPWKRPWLKMREEAMSKVRTEMEGRILATDLSRAAIESARQNARDAGVERYIEFKVCEFQETPVPKAPGVVIMNPEYGLRMGKPEDLHATYKQIGDFLKQNCKGYRGFVFTGNMDLAKSIGLRSNSRTQFFNGPIECRLLEFELYEGTRKEKDPIEAPGADKPAATPLPRPHVPRPPRPPKPPGSPERGWQTPKERTKEGKDKGPEPGKDRARKSRSRYRGFRKAE